MTSQVSTGWWRPVNCGLEIAWLKFNTALDVLFTSPYMELAYPGCDKKNLQIAHDY